MKGSFRLVIVLMLSGLAATAAAGYDEYCQELAGRLATDPEGLGMAELERLEECTRALRAGARVEDAGEGAFCSRHCPQPEVTACPPPPDLASVCPSFMDDRRRRDREGRTVPRPHIPGRQ